MLNRNEWLPEMLRLLKDSKDLLFDLHKKVDFVLGHKDIFDSEVDYVINQLLDLFQALDKVRPVIGRALEFLESEPIDRNLARKAQYYKTKLRFGEWLEGELLGQPVRFKFKEMFGWPENLDFVVEIEREGNKFTVDAGPGHIRIEPKLYDEDVLSEMGSSIIEDLIVGVFLPESGCTEGQIDGWFDGEFVIAGGKFMEEEKE